MQQCVVLIQCLLLEPLNYIIGIVFKIHSATSHACSFSQGNDTRSLNSNIFDLLIVTVCRIVNISYSKAWAYAASLISKQAALLFVQDSSSEPNFIVY